MRTLEREPDERQLIEAAQGEPARFADLYEQNFARVYAFFARRVTTREEAQDLTAEVFHQALASIGGFRWQGAPFIAWLYGIAANVLSSHWQRLGRSPVGQETELCDAVWGWTRRRSRQSRNGNSNPGRKMDIRSRSG